MASDLYAYSISLKGRVQSSGISSDLLSLDISSSLESLKNAYSLLRGNALLNEYWCCIFLLSCEDNSPCIPVLGLQVFLDHFRVAIQGALRSEPQVKRLYADCIDGIILNELIELNDDDLKVRQMAQILEIFIEFERFFDGFDFSFKKQAENTLANVWGKISLFNTGDFPTDEIVQVTRDVWIAAKAGLNTNDVGYPLADSIIEYIEHLNNGQLDEPQSRFNPDNINTSHLMINQLEEFCQEEEVKLQVKEYREKLNKIAPFQASQIRDASSRANPSAFMKGSIHPSDITVLEESIYAMPKQNIRVSISKGLYNRIDVCLKTYIAQNNIQELREVEKEIKIYETLSLLSRDSNCFIRFYGTIVEEKSVRLVMDWYPNDLNEIINKRANVAAKINEMTFIEIAYTLVSSFATMAQNNIFHNDIKPHNILAKDLNDGWILKIIDFNVSLIKNNDIKGTSTHARYIQGTEGWLSPQKQAKQKFDPEKSDVYSLGLVLYQFLTYKNTQSTSFQQIQDDIQALAFNSTTKDFLSKLLTYDESQRPTFAKSLEFLERAQKTVKQTTGQIKK